MIITSPHQQEPHDLREQVSKLTAIIADLKAQKVTPSPPPAPDPTADLAHQLSQITSAVSNLQTQFSQLMGNPSQDYKSPARKKLCPTMLEATESHASIIITPRRNHNTKVHQIIDSGTLGLVLAGP
jgi:hypothetical protein